LRSSTQGLFLWKKFMNHTSRYARAKQAAEYLNISKSSLWQWVKTRPDFPKPLKASSRVTLFDIAAIEQFLLAQAGK
jgi:prophage regulatory protein